MTRLATQARCGLKELLEHFPADPGRGGREIRQTLKADAGGFLREFIQDSEHDEQHRGFRYALVLLNSENLLAPAIVDPSATTMEQAQRLTRSMLAVDPNFLNETLDLIMHRQWYRRTPVALRLLDLIERTPERIANWRSIARLYERGEGKVKPWAAALLARYRFDEEKLSQRFEQSDSRGRANIVEALWNEGESKLERLNEKAAQDSNNRVAGNACLAMYRTGQTQVIETLAGMLESEQETFRITAAWVMGQTRDIRFADLLAEAARSDDTGLRERASAALELIDHRCGETARLRPFCVLARVKGDSYEAWIRVEGENGQIVEGLKPIDFFVYSVDGPVMRYEVEALEANRPAAVAIVYPSDWEEFREAVAMQAPAMPILHQWAIGTYGAAGTQGKTVGYLKDSAAVRRSLAEGPRRARTISEICREILALAITPDIDRHLVVMLEDAEGMEDDILAECARRRIHIHGMSREEDAGKAWSRWLSLFGYRYAVRAPVEEAPASLAIREQRGAELLYSPRVQLPNLAGGSGEV